MSQGEHFAQVQQLQELEEDQVDEANKKLQELRDEEFRAEIEAKYPILKGWTK